MTRLWGIVIVALAGIGLAGCTAPPPPQPSRHPTPHPSASVATAKNTPTPTPPLSVADLCGAISRWTEGVANLPNDLGVVIPTAAIQDGVKKVVDEAVPGTGLYSDLLLAQSVVASSPLDLTKYNQAAQQLAADCKSTNISPDLFMTLSTPTPTPTPTPSVAAPDAPQTYTVTVSGSGSALVTYGTLSGQQQVTVTLPWSTTVPQGLTQFSDIVSLVAQSQSGGAGTIGCSITDTSSGYVFASNSSSGVYAVVSCTN